VVRRVCRYQRGNKNPLVEERQTIKWSKEKRTNNDLQNTTQKTKDGAKRTPLSPGGELM
jgi:hypothetical protein